MLQKMTEIEGLEAFEDVRLANDTNPGATQIEFSVQSEEMPALTAAEGKIVRKNFVWITKRVNLGSLVYQRRIKDKVIYDEETKRWKVLKLAEPKSDIAMYPQEWNAFARGTQGDVVGTPLSMIFPTDPAKVEHYKSLHIKTIEQLWSQKDIGPEMLPMGGRADIAKAGAFLERARGDANGNAASLEIKKLAERLQIAEAQNRDLTEKLTQVLQAQLEVRPKVKKPKTKTIEPQPAV